MDAAKASEQTISPDAQRRRRRLAMMDGVAVNRVLEDLAPAWIRRVAAGQTAGEISAAEMTTVSLVGGGGRRRVPAIRVDVTRPALSKHRPAQSAAVYILAPDRIVVRNRTA